MQRELVRPSDEHPRAMGTSDYIFDRGGICEDFNDVLRRPALFHFKELLQHLLLVNRSVFMNFELVGVRWRGRSSSIKAGQRGMLNAHGRF